MISLTSHLQHPVHCQVQQYTYDSDFPSSFRIEVEMTNAKFKITPLALLSLLSSTLTYDSGILSFSNEAKITMELS